ncbi:MAG: hypothetical protein ACRELC_02670 [Gemmatimonadota bacterium]
MKKLTPVLCVEAIELKKGGVEIMYQTRSSIAGDVPQLAGTPAGGSLLYIEVEDDLDGVESALEGVEIVHPRRTSFYGADELIVRPVRDSRPRGRDPGRDTPPLRVVFRWRPCERGERT